MPTLFTTLHILRHFCPNRWACWWISSDILSRVCIKSYYKSCVNIRGNIWPLHFAEGQHLEPIFLGWEVPVPSWPGLGKLHDTNTHNILAETESMLIMFIITTLVLYRIFFPKLSFLLLYRVSQWLLTMKFPQMGETETVKVCISAKWIQKLHWNTYIILL